MASRVRFNDAVRVLYASQTARALIPEMQSRRHEVIDIMNHYVERIGVDLLSLPVVHIAGTKGKGSTATMVTSLLQAEGVRTGLFTSPHLVSPCERIRVGGKPISEDKFAHYFFAVYDKLKATEHLAGTNPPMPSFFRLATLVALNAFVGEEVEVAILEVGLGGRLDATNVIRNPLVTGITTLDYDHMSTLGETLPEIAYEKAGIFKKSVPGFTVPQDPDALKVLHLEAARAKCTLQNVEGSDLKAMNGGVYPLLGLAGDFQRVNASLAVHLARTALARMAGKEPPTTWPPLSKTELEGLERARWAGRAQTLALPTLGERHEMTSLEEPEAVAAARALVHVDGAHTERSMAVAVQWFRQVCSASPADSSAARILIFNCGHDKDALELLLPLSTFPFTHVFICPFDYAKPTSKAIPGVAKSVEDYFNSRRIREGTAVSSKEVADVKTLLAPLSPASGTTVADDGTVTGPLAWQRVLADLWAQVHGDSARWRSERFRHANGVTPYGGGGDYAGETKLAEEDLPSAATAAEPVVCNNLDEVLEGVHKIVGAAPGGDAKHHILATGSLYLVGGMLQRLTTLAPPEL